nr:reverse transcriptase domain-containing protein [Tanacetum cinerariifolium]
MKMNTASSSGSGTLPSNIITNPKEDLKGITTRSGTAYQGTTIPTTSSSLPKVVERETEVTKGTVPPTNNESTKDVQPPLVQTETPIPNSEPVVTPIIEPVVAPTEKALVDVYEGELTLRVGKETITFNLDQTSRYSANYNDMMANQIDVIDMAYKDYSQEVLGFSDVIARNYLPQVQKELKICKAKNDKSSIDEPPEVELKDFPPHLEYAFLEGDDKFLVIIAKDLSDEEKTAVIKVLKSHKRAIAWKLFDIKGINPEFHTHKILMEEDFKPAVQHQRRVNTKIHDVIKKEVEKLLDAGLIYPISNSPWVSPVHCVPKKGGFTVVENEENELILTRLVTGWRVTFKFPSILKINKRSHSCILMERLPTVTCLLAYAMHRARSKEKMLKQCEDTNLCLNWEKSHFMVKEGIVLGYKISKNRIKVDKAKVDVIAKLPHPTTVKGRHSSSWRILNDDPSSPPLPPQVLKVVKPKNENYSIDEPPVVELKHLPPHLEYAFLEVIKKEVLKLFDTGLIYPISDSPWVSPVHCVPKKAGFTVVENKENELIPTRLVTGWRVCTDYRKLNDATCKDHFSLPFMDQMLERLAGNEYYCFLDGFSGYFQIPIDPKIKKRPHPCVLTERLPTVACLLAYAMHQACSKGNNQGRTQFFQEASHGQKPPPVYQAPAYQALGYQAPVHQPPSPQSQVVTTNEFTNYLKVNNAILKNMQTNMTSLINSNLVLKNLFGLFMKMNTASSSGSGTLPSNIITNPKEDLKGITTRSGTAYQGTTIPTTSSSLPKVVERETEVTKDTVPHTNNESTKDVQPPVVQTETPIPNSEPVATPIIEPVVDPVSASKPNQKLSIPYPSRLHDQKLCDKANDQKEKIFQIFQDLNFNISFADALILMPKFGPTIKTLLTNKDK